jgi:hypothetical protein
MLDEVTEAALTPAARPPIKLRRVTFDKSHENPPVQKNGFNASATI